jgi:hypothetical protein
MVLLEKQPKLLLVVIIISILFIISACDANTSGINSLSEVTGYYAIDRYTPMDPLDTDFECYRDSDCGTDTFFGDTFCKDNDIYQKYRYYRCLSTVDSSDCRDFVEDRILEECDEARNEVCVAGADFCLTEAPMEEVVERIDRDGPECKEDVDCGVSGMRNKPFCDGDSYDYMVIFTCVHRDCITDREKVLLDECDNYCIDGECSKFPEGYECLEDADCGKDGVTGVPSCRPGNTVFMQSKVNICQINDKGSSCTYRLSFFEVGPCPKGQKCVQSIGCVPVVEDVTSGDVITNVTPNVTTNVSVNTTINITVNATPNITQNITTNITNNVSANITGNISMNVSSNITTNLTANVTVNITQNITNGTSTGGGDNKDKPVGPQQFKVLGTRCEEDEKIGQGGFSGNFFCQDGDLHAFYVNYVCKDGYSDKSVENRIVEKCGSYTFCLDGRYSCQNKIVDLKISEILLVPGKPFIVNKPFDVYLKIENLGVNATLYGLLYNLTYPSGYVRTQETPLKFEIQGHETKTVFLTTEELVEQGSYNLYFKLLSSKPEDPPFYDNNEANVTIDVFGEQPECLEKNWLGVCTRVNY